jgi:hypothetical protein
VKNRLLILLAVLLVVVLGRAVFFHAGVYNAPSLESVLPAEPAKPLAPSVESPEVDSTSDAAASEEPGTETDEERAIVAVDVAHGNLFELDEVSPLASELALRDARVKFYDGDELGEALHDTDSFIVICPEGLFSADELEALADFVDDGGRLLLIGEPTRSSQIGRLSLEFGLVFEPGYLYNLEENEINFRNVFVRAFAKHRVTAGIEELVLYTAGSIGPAERGIAFADEKTFSSVVETRTRLSPMALSGEGNVLAIYDFTFMTEPHNGILDNGLLLSNVAGWLVSAVVEAEEEAELDETPLAEETTEEEPAEDQGPEDSVEESG